MATETQANRDEPQHKNVGMARYLDDQKKYIKADVKSLRCSIRKEEEVGGQDGCRELTSAEGG